MEIVKLCIRATVFQKFDKLYKQVKGVTVGIGNDSGVDNAVYRMIHTY